VDISEDRLITLILENIKDLTREKLESMIHEKISELRVSRKTALYLIMIEYGISISSPIEKRISFSDLTDGLSNIDIVGKLLWLKPTEEHKEVFLCRGGIMDESSILPILFWGRRKEDITNLGIDEGDIIEVSGAYTKMGLTGSIEIHVPNRAKIRQYRERVEIPIHYELLTPLDQDISRLTIINTYGRILSKLNERVVKINDEDINVASFLLGYGKSFRRVVIWRRVIDEYRWLKPGSKIILYLGRVKINKFGEAEIHLTRDSHIIEDELLDVPLKVEEKKLADIRPGLNLLKIRSVVLAKGLERYNPERNRITRSALIADETREATLVLLGDKVKEFENIEGEDEIEISVFRASIKGDSIIIFADESTVIKKIGRSNMKPVVKIVAKNIDELSIEDKIINVRGRIIKGPVQTGDYVDLKFLLAEDENGKPFKIVFRGEISNYSDKPIKEGDDIIVEAGLLDLYPLLIGRDMPTIKLRAYSIIKPL